MISVRKESGLTEPFSEDKVLSSIKRAGIPKDKQQLLLSHIKNKIYNNIPTSEIYSHIMEFFDQENDYYSKSKYSLKRAIMELGPTGFPFEVYVGEVLKSIGFKVEIGRILSGKCVNHEVDIIGQKEGRKIFVECKFHNRTGIKSDVQVSLYTKARFDDIREKHQFSEALLVTNTKISSDGLAYALCENIKVISWSYPENQSLRDLIEIHKLFPVTILNSLSATQKQELLSNNIVLARDLSSSSEVFSRIPSLKNREKEILSEVRGQFSL